MNLATRGACFALVAAAAWPADVRADSWYATPELSAAAEYRSNPDFAPDPRAGTLTAVDAAVPVAWLDDQLAATLAPRVRLAETSGAARASPNAYSLLGALTRAAERGSIGVRGGYSDESTLDGPRDAVDAFRIDARRRRLDAGVDLTRSISERVEVQASAGWQRTYFGGTNDAVLTDFRAVDATLGLAWAITERLALTAGAAAMRYRTDALDVRQRTLSLQAGVRWAAAADTTMRAEYGRSRARTDGSESSDGVVYLASLERRWPRATLAATAEQQVAPSGFGAITRARTLDLRWNLRLTERLSLDASGSDARNEDLFPTPFGQFGIRRRLRTLSSGVSWQVTEAWSLGGSVGWQSQALGPVAGWRDGLVASLVTRRTFGRVRLD